MNLDSAYYHGINPTAEINVDIYNLNVSFKVLKRILKNKNVKSLHYQGEKERESASYADLDKICLCKDFRKMINEPINKFNCSYDAYSRYVLYRYSIILSAHMKGIEKPNLVSIATIKSLSSQKYKKLLDQNCTDLFDEFRAYYYLSLKDDAIAIGVPHFAVYSYFRENSTNRATDKCINKFAKHLEVIQKRIDKSKLNLPIVDSELGAEVTKIDKEYVEMLEEQRQKRRILVNL